MGSITWTYEDLKNSSNFSKLSYAQKLLFFGDEIKASYSKEQINLNTYYNSKGVVLILLVNKNTYNTQNI